MVSIYSFACTRSGDRTQTSKNLEEYFSRYGITHTWLEDKDSIFTAYYSAVNNKDLKPSDIVILCHDDIEIWDDPVNFHKQLSLLNDPRIGFIGPAGTTCLGQDAIWWDMEKRKQGLHRGFVWQGTDRSNFYPNHFGRPGSVVCLDGCFLAAKVSTLRNIRLEKPVWMECEWDFYDIYYTVSAHRKGFINHAVPIHILHNSPGEMRDSWHKNRRDFIRKYRLPIKCI